MYEEEVEAVALSIIVGIQLPKGQEVENKTTIEITKGFLSFYKDKNGMAKPKVVVQEYKVLFISDGLPF